MGARRERAARGGDRAAAGSAGREGAKGEQWQEAGAGPVLICRPAPKLCTPPPPDLTPHRLLAARPSLARASVDGWRPHPCRRSSGGSAGAAVARGLFSRSLLAKLHETDSISFFPSFPFPVKPFPSVLPFFFLLFVEPTPALRQFPKRYRVLTEQNGSHFRQQRAAR